VAWTVEVTDQFEAWWDHLSEDERVSIDGMIHVLEAHGPLLDAPYSIETAGSRYPQLRQLRVPHQGRDICVLYISDDWRSTLVLLTGGAAGRGEEFCSPEQVSVAEAIYGTYLAGGRGQH
jgi:hypothetical protein